MLLLRSEMIVLILGGKLLLSPFRTQAMRCW